MIGGVSVKWDKLSRDAFVKFTGIPRDLIFFLPDDTCLIKNRYHVYQKYDDKEMRSFWVFWGQNKYDFRG